MTRTLVFDVVVCLQCSYMLVVVVPLPQTPSLHPWVNIFSMCCAEHLVFAISVMDVESLGHFLECMDNVVGGLARICKELSDHRSRGPKMSCSTSAGPSESMHFENSRVSDPPRRSKNQWCAHEQFEIDGILDPPPTPLG